MKIDSKMIWLKAAVFLKLQALKSGDTNALMSIEY
jgi:hypothetical protein